MIKVLIVDDDMLAHERLRSMLTAYPYFEVAYDAGTLEEAKKILAEQSPDILFLDLELPDGNGMELLSMVNEYHPGMYVVVFTGFYHDVNEEAYKHGESDYLLKPILPDELDKVIRRYMATVQNNDKATIDGSILRKEKLYDTVALMTINNELRPVKCSEIGFFRYEGKKKIWAAVLNDSLLLTLRKETTAQDIIRLSPLFQQSHQSFIVNLSYVELIGNTQVKLKQPFQRYSIPMGRTFLSSFHSRFKMI